MPIETNEGCEALIVKVVNFYLIVKTAKSDSLTIRAETNTGDSTLLPYEVSEPLILKIPEFHAFATRSSNNLAIRTKTDFSYLSITT